ncbi:transport-ATP binding protein [Pyrococcus sp. NA2]|uniref:tungstate ABC transporter ATP-binding protein WtpC n=1 Tax=Pyrococcus sp. (strain NA2) TaxID=342949 RepID=UPI000209AD45|nr:tungstate ABC transporter ATP-binding protein WtpC [Pyrococcus sp. NA2]AEC51609.1 transport-ATP binding protein [Pyrococcus sp. NA2]
MLEVKSISKDYGDFKLRDISFDVKRREHFIILGPSGAGKTVLLEIIAGVIEPDSGKLLLDGRDITDLPPEKRNFAYIPQNYALFPHLSVFDNIAFGLKLRKLPREEIERKVREVSETLGISHLLHRKPGTLSGGEQQRVAIARALVIEPELLLMDEPFANLDVQLKAKLIGEMKRWRKEFGFTAIHVTHSFEEALSLGDRVGVMLKGRLVQVGKLREVFSNPRNEEVARFLGFENVLEGIGKGSYVEVNGLEISVVGDVRGRVRLGIRPEDIVISRKEVESSARNSFRGMIEGIEDLGPIVKVSVNVSGIRFRAIVTKSSAVDMDLEEGSEVWIVFKASSVRVF